MLISEKFVLASLLPQGGPSIEKMVRNTVGGEAPNKAAKTSAELAALGKPVLAHVCDPRGWYLALWRQGCARQGDIYKRLTDEKRWELVRARLLKRDPSASDEGGSVLLPAAWSAEHAETFWYGDSQSVEAFREWLGAMLDTRPLRSSLSSAYQKSPLSRSSGLMSFEYMELFINNPSDLNAPPATAKGLLALDASHGVIAQRVRAETVGVDFIAAMEAFEVPLDDEQRAHIAAEPDRREGLEREWERFYDEASWKLLLSRERFIFTRFGYKLRSPRPPRRGAAEGAARPEKAPPDAAELERRARIAEVKRLQQERLAAREAARSAEPDKPAPAVPAKAAPVSAATRRPRLADFDED